MILNSATDVIYNGSSVQSLFYNGRQVWPVTKTAITMTLKHQTYPTADYNRISAEAYDPYTNVHFSNVLGSSTPSSVLGYVPLNSILDIYCGRMDPLNSLYIINNTEARFGSGIHLKADQDIEVSAKLIGVSSMKWSASGYIMPISTATSNTDLGSSKGTHFRAPLILTDMSGCVWSAMKTGLMEYTDTDGVVHSSSVEYPWITCPSSTANGTLQASSFRVYVNNAAYIYGTPPVSTSMYSAKVEPFSAISSFADGSIAFRSTWAWVKPTIYESSDLYWDCGIQTGSGLSAISPSATIAHTSLYPGNIRIESFGTWSATGEWT